MGYIFDAINQNDDEQPKREHEAESFDHEATTGDLESSFEDEAPLEIDAKYDFQQTNFAEPIEHDAEHVDEETQPAFTFSTHNAGLDLEQFDDRLVALTDPSAHMAEEYRAIRTSLLARWEHRRNLVHTITSATPQEGKTITSMNLGLTLAELRNRRTIVVEADLRLPTFDKLLGIQSQTGMIDYLRGETPWDQTIQQIGDHPLHIITAGGTHTQGEAVQLLSSQRFANLVQQLRSRYDHVIIDTPPVVELSDAGIVGSHSDDVMLVVRMKRTPRTLVEQAIRTLQNYHAPVAGAIATDESRHRHNYYYYRYGYRSRYGYGQGESTRKAA